jgi:integration host factor subunit alpha
MAREKKKVSIQTEPLFPQVHPSMTLTKNHITESIRNRLGISKFESSRIVESVLETIKTSLSNGEDVLISGFGKFSVKKKAPRRGRNPATGEDLTLESQMVITFKCSPRMQSFDRAHDR